MVTTGMVYQSRKCVLIKHGLSMRLSQPNRRGVCCYNIAPRESYTSYDISPKDCTACIQQEHSGIYSYRQGANNKYGLDHSHDLPLVIDIVPDRTCNLACKICNKDSSSLWQILEDKSNKQKTSMSEQEFLSYFDNIDLSQVREINFSGGEPLLNDAMIRYVSLLQHMIDFSRCTLRFSTNGTVSVKRNLVKEFFQMFDQILIRFSLDDITVGHEYQRWPSKWHDWLEVWNDCLDHLPHNVLPSINRTVGVLNINRLNLLDDWIKDYQLTKFGDRIEVIDHFAFGVFSLHNLPTKLKQHVLDMHGQTSRAWSYINHIPGLDDPVVLRQRILEIDRLHQTSCHIFDPDLARSIFGE
jgi:uncharacterized Fe-S cluster-containing radical SAM superfamily protein